MESEYDRRRRLDPAVHEAGLHAWDQWPLALAWMLGLSPLLILGLEVGASAWSQSRFGTPEVWDAPLSTRMKTIIYAVLLCAASLAAAAPFLLWLVAFLRSEHGPRTGMVGRARRRKLYRVWLLVAAATLAVNWGRPTMGLSGLVFATGGLSLCIGLLMRRGSVARDA